jgi:Na+-driven multidrug efflux pump
MKAYSPTFRKRVLQILVISLIAFSMDRLIVRLSHDDTIWMGEAIEAVGSVIFGPLVGFFGAFLNCTVSDYLTYHSFDYIFVDTLEAVAVALIGVIFRKLNRDEDQFGIQQVVIFNFVQILVNVVVLYLSTVPVAMFAFKFIVDDWTKADILTDMAALGDNTFSACVSVALIGTLLLAQCIFIRRKLREKGSVSAALRSIFKPTFLKKEYGHRAFAYTVGLVLAIGLTMIDGVVSGHVLGTDALAATSLVFPLVSLSAFIATIFTYGCSNLCAIAEGSGDYERARRLFTLGLFATLLLGLAQSGLFYLMEDIYFSYYNSSPAIEAFAREYYRLFIFVPPVMALATFLDAMISADGDDTLSYVGYLVSFGVNVGASVFLARTMGMSGLALGTALSYVSYLIVVSIHFLKKSNTYRLRYWFSFRDLLRFAQYSLRNNTAGLCMSVVSAGFTKAILIFWGNDYLIANTVLCAMLEIYEMINGPSEAAGYLLASYTGEKNGEGIKTLFRQALVACAFGGMAVTLLLLILPNTVLLLYGIEDTPLRVDLVKCIRFCSLGVVAASIGGFLSDYYGYTGNPLWSCMMVVFRTALFPILFCVNFCLEGGIVSMAKGMVLSQITAMAVFYSFVLIIKGRESIPYMLDDPDYGKVSMNSFEYQPEEYERLWNWIQENLNEHGIESGKIGEVGALLQSLFRQTEEKTEKTRCWANVSSDSSGSLRSLSRTTARCSSLTFRMIA